MFCRKYTELIYFSKINDKIYFCHLEYIGRFAEKKDFKIYIEEWFYNLITAGVT